MEVAIEQTTQNPKHIQRKTAKGASAIALRQLIVHGTNALGAILLARLLTTAEFGVYAIVLFLLTFLTTFAGAGLAANLIRQEAEPSTQEYRVVFTFQIAIVILIALAMSGVSRWVSALYHLPGNDAWLLSIIAIALVIASLQVIPQVQLERHIEFGTIARIEITQTFAFNATAVMLAWLHYGVLSFGVAVLARAITGALLANLAAPWRMGCAWDSLLAKRHFAYGMYFQGVGLIGFLKDAINPVLIGIVLGTSDVGLVNWAAMLASYVLLALNGFQRIYLPAFARLQEHREDLARFVELVVFLANALVASAGVVLLSLVHPVTTIVFGAKWVKAIPLFYLFWIANIFTPTAMPLTGLLNALGRARYTFLFSVAFMLATWSFGAPLIFKYGIVGLAIGSVITQLVNIPLYVVAYRELPFKFLQAVVPAWLPAIPVFAALFLLTRYSPVTNVMHLALAGISGFALYLLLLSILQPGRYRQIQQLWAAQ